MYEWSWKNYEECLSHMLYFYVLWSEGSNFDQVNLSLGNRFSITKRIASNFHVFKVHLITKQHDNAYSFDSCWALEHNKNLVYWCCKFLLILFLQQQFKSDKKVQLIEFIIFVHAVCLFIIMENHFRYMKLENIYWIEISFSDYIRSILWAKNVLQNSV